MSMKLDNFHTLFIEVIRQSFEADPPTDLVYLYEVCSWLLCKYSSYSVIFRVRVDQKRTVVDD